MESKEKRQMPTPGIPFFRPTPHVEAGELYSVEKKPVLLVYHPLAGIADMVRNTVRSSSYKQIGISHVISTAFPGIPEDQVDDSLIIDLLSATITVYRHHKFLPVLYLSMTLYSKLELVLEVMNRHYDKDDFYLTLVTITQEGLDNVQGLSKLRFTEYGDLCSDMNYLFSELKERNYTINRYHKTATLSY